MTKLFKFDKELFKVTSPLGTVSLFSLALPIFFEYMMSRLQGTVHTALLSGYSENAVAAVGSASRLIDVFMMLFTMITTGATVVISIHIGAERFSDARQTSFVAIALCLIIALVCAPMLLFFSNGLISLLNLEAEIGTDALVYFRIRTFFIVFWAMTSVFLTILRCYGYPKYTFVIGLTTNIVNLLLTVFVIYFPRISPVTGVAGVAFACILSQLAGLLVTICIFRRLRLKTERPASLKSFFINIRGILRIGLPSVLSNMSYTISQTVNASFVALIGGYALSAQVYFSDIVSYVFLFSSSIGVANALMIGRLCGAGEYEKANRVNAQLVKVTIAINLLMSLIIILLRNSLLSLFTDNPLIFAIALPILAIDLIAEQARAVSQVYEYALRAAGDVLFSLIALVISCWVLGIGLSYYLAIRCNLGLVGCWIGLAADESVRGIVTYFRWKSGRWKTAKL